MKVNHKRIYRLYREEGLKVRKRARKRVARTRVEIPRPTAVGQSWSTDFMSDTLPTADGSEWQTLSTTTREKR